MNQITIFYLSLPELPEPYFVDVFYSSYALAYWIVEHQHSLTLCPNGDNSVPIQTIEQIMIMFFLR